MNVHEKAHSEVGVGGLLNSYEPATEEALASDERLNKLNLILPPNSLLNITDNITITAGHEVSKVEPTANTIGLTLRDKQGNIVGAVFYKPNSKKKPIIIDPTGYGAIVIGDFNKVNEVIAFNDIDDGSDAYLCMMDTSKTVIVSAQKTKHCFKQVVQHWGSSSLVTVPMTLDDKGIINLLAGVNARALVTVAHIVTLLQANESYDTIADSAEVIELAETAYYPEWRKDRAPQLNEPMICTNGRFELYHDGLFFVKYDKSNPSNILYKQKVFVCSPIEVIAKTRDESSATWGRLLQWRDDDGVLHQWLMPLDLLQGDTREYRRELARQGLSITTNNRQRSYLDAYIQGYVIQKRALCVDKLGWHDKQYVLPDRTIGDDGKQLIIYQSAHTINNTISQKGTLAQWRDQLSKPLAEQSRFVFSIACAFAGQLLELLDDDGGGFHIVGSSTMGKSLSLKVAASVWGNPDRYVKTWRSTDNALEGIASECNDGFLPLDEISDSDAKAVGRTIYMLGNGTGKGRSTVTGHNRTTKTWRIIFLSNGEESLQNFMAQAGQKTNAGIEVRVAHIDADAGAGNDLRTFDSLVLADTGAAQADKIKELYYRYYGVAGMAWLEHITTDKIATTATAKQLVNDFMSKYSDLAPQAHRVAKRFAIVATAGEMATQAGITGWQVGQATTAVMTCLDNWLDNYGRDGEHEERQIIKHIQAFIEQHGSSRFEPRNSYRCADIIGHKTSNRIGYRNIKTGDYYFLKNAFETEVCPPFNVKKVLQVLDDAKLLRRNQGDRKDYKTPDTIFEDRKPVYAVKAYILSYEADESTGTAETGGKGQAQQAITTVPIPKPPLRQLGQTEQQRDNVSQPSQLNKNNGTAESPVNMSNVPPSHLSQAQKINMEISSGFIYEPDDEIPPFGCLAANI